MPSRLSDSSLRLITRGSTICLRANASRRCVRFEARSAALRISPELRLERVRRPEPGVDEIGVAEDDRQHVVDVVGDAAGEAADALELLHLRELLLEPAPLGHVLLRCASGGAAARSSAPGRDPRARRATAAARPRRVPLGDLLRQLRGALVDDDAQRALARLAAAGRGARQSGRRRGRSRRRRARRTTTSPRTASRRATTSVAPAGSTAVAVRRGHPEAIAAAAQVRVVRGAAIAGLDPVASAPSSW